MCVCYSCDHWYCFVAGSRKSLSDEVRVYIIRVVHCIAYTFSRLLVCACIYYRLLPFKPNVTTYLVYVVLQIHVFLCVLLPCIHVVLLIIRLRCCGI